MMISYLVVIAKFDDLAHALHQGVQILGLRVAAAQRGDSGDEITLLVAFDDNGEFSLRLHTDLPACPSLPRQVAAGGFAPDEQQQGQQVGQDSEPGGDEGGGESGRDARVFLQQKRKEIRGVVVHATGLARGVVTQPPLVRFAQCDGGDVLEAQASDECGVAQSVHLVDFEGMPENHGSQLNGHAEKDNAQTELPENPAESGAVTQQQRNGNHGQKFDGSGDVAVAPGEIAAPNDVLGVEKDISHQQPQTGEQISLDGRTKAPPNQQ